MDDVDPYESHQDRSSRALVALHTATMAPPSSKTETEQSIQATDLWLSHLISRAATPVPLSPRSFFRDLEPIIEAHCIVIAGGIPLDRSTTFTPDKDARRQVHASHMQARDGQCLLLEDCTMTIIERFRYLRNLKDMLEIGGEVAVYLAMQCHQPIELCLLEFSVSQFTRWWQGRRNSIPNQVKLHARDRAQRYEIERLINEAVPRPTKRRCRTSEFCQRVSRNVVVHFKGGIGNNHPITNRDALAEGHVRLLNDVLGRNGKTFQDCFVFAAILKHIFDTGGERALMASVLSVAPQDLWEVDYRRQEFERCWEVLDKPFDSWQRLDQLVEASSKVKMLRSKLLELVQRYPEIPYRPSIKQRIKAGKLRTIG